MILIDFMGHMISDESVEELHAFAKRLGLKREWFQTPGFGEKHAHYDLTTSRMRQKAIDKGATQVTPFELVKRAWWNEEET